MKTETSEGWVAIWALTSGIFKTKGKRHAGYPDMVEITVPEGGAEDRVLVYEISKEDWHTTRQAAVKQAQQMRRQRIAALTKELNRLKGLRFKSPRPLTAAQLKKRKAAAEAQLKKKKKGRPLPIACTEYGQISQKTYRKCY